jgi:hypothetical protein
MQVLPTKRCIRRFSCIPFVKIFFSATKHQGCAFEKSLFSHSFEGLLKKAAGRSGEEFAHETRLGIGILQKKKLSAHGVQG